MIREPIQRFNRVFNGYSTAKQRRWLAGFCMIFLLLLYAAVRIVPFNTRMLNNAKPNHIGRRSGQLMGDKLTHKKQ